MFKYTPILIYLSIIISTISCKKAACSTGMIRCSEDYSHIQHCKSGEWIELKRCEDKMICSAMGESTAESNHNHGTFDYFSGSLMCVLNHINEIHEETSHNNEETSHNNEENEDEDHGTGEDEVGADEVGEHEVGGHEDGESTIHEEDAFVGEESKESKESKE